MSQWFVTGEFDSPEPLGVDLGPETILLFGDTGSGKTTLFSEFARRMNCPGLVLVHRRELAAHRLAAH